MNLCIKGLSTKSVLHISIILTNNYKHGDSANFEFILGIFTVVRIQYSGNFALKWITEFDNY